MVCVARESVCKRAGEAKSWGFNFALKLSRRWAPATVFQAADPIIPSDKLRYTGFQYRALADGPSNGAIEPRWPKVLTGSKSRVVDGAITWQTEALTDESLIEYIVDQTWTAESGIDVTANPYVAAAGNQSVSAMFEGGTAGTTYEVVVEILTNRDHRYHAILQIEVE